MGMQWREHQTKVATVCAWISLGDVRQKEKHFPDSFLAGEKEMCIHFRFRTTTIVSCPFTDDRWKSISAFYPWQRSFKKASYVQKGRKGISCNWIVTCKAPLRTVRPNLSFRSVLSCSQPVVKCDSAIHLVPPQKNGDPESKQIFRVHTRCHCGKISNAGAHRSVGPLCVCPLLSLFHTFVRFENSQSSHLLWEVESNDPCFFPCLE